MADPVIYNIQSRYAIDDELRINCTSFDYGPASRLHWIINGQLVRIFNCRDNQLFTKHVQRHRKIKKK